MDHRIQQLRPQPFPLPKQTKPVQQQGGSTFSDVLAEVQDLKISKHAKQRLVERNIKIDSTQWMEISKKIDEASQKGITDSLVVTKDAALLVSAKNKTIVTALDRGEASSKIFTNINGTILLDD
ncbi:flagellar protein [Aquibacillus sp. 3ASR75-11]|uniref:Flagellar protein n=1 Tax=Terrihalobacillus insolitus TaxID=2950438 RepID=A0A9X3WRY9_9BACI|nr:TIGR02530 family flagellar biosynthesis protein [Terrihalobacillus insolitus]MDC3414132.1 flagellar protein [Terrihalobacillus insolitus]MDC3423573.1 flagellar protein [Terrihalobacillus insolitus]